MKNLLLSLLIIFFGATLIISCTKSNLNNPAALSQNLKSNGKVNPDVPYCGIGNHWDFYLGKCVEDCPTGYHNDSITGACVANQIPVSLQTQEVTNNTLKTTLISTFQNLATSGVNLVELSNELGLSYTINADSIDFTNIVMTWDANNAAGKAVTANFKSNSNSNNIGFGFAMYYDGTTLFEPSIIKTSKNQYLKYYDLTDGSIITLNNYASPSYAFSITYGSYISGGGQVSPQLRAGCGQAVMDCMTNLYTNRGWLSVWATLQTLVIPETGFVVAATCAADNCNNRQQ